jgi:hypothetical protein
VSARIALGGYTAASFGATQQAAFSAALAARLGVASADVAVTGVSDYVARRRALTPPTRTRPCSHRRRSGGGV